MLNALPPGYIYCWFCRFSWDATDDSCKTDPIVAQPYPNIITCNVAAHNACYTQNINFPNGSMYYFQRGCQVNDTPGCMTTSMTSCTNYCYNESLCNGRSTRLGATTPAPPEPSFNCYDCSYEYSMGSDPETNDCVMDPASVPLPNNVTCNYTAGNECYTRQENFLMSGKLAKLDRGCRPAGESQCYDDTYHICDDYCTSDFCNDQLDFSGGGSEGSSSVAPCAPTLHASITVLPFFCSLWEITYKLIVKKVTIP